MLLSWNPFPAAAQGDPVAKARQDLGKGSQSAKDSQEPLLPLLVVGIEPRAVQVVHTGPKTQLYLCICLYFVALCFVLRQGLTMLPRQALMLKSFRLNLWSS